MTPPIMILGYSRAVIRYAESVNKTSPHFRALCHCLNKIHSNRLIRYISSKIIHDLKNQYLMMTCVDARVMLI